MPLTSLLLLALGLILVVVGVALASIPAAFMVAGVGVCAAVLLIDPDTIRRSRK